MELLEILLKQLIGAEQCGGTTMAIEISMGSSSLCSAIKRFSTCGGDLTTIKFIPSLPLEHAILHARDYTEKGSFEHKS